MAGTVLFGIDVETASEHTLGFIERALPLFRELGVRTTWYVTGKTLEAYPEAFQKVAADGLVELQSHTYDHLLLKTVLLRVPAGMTIHDSKDWFMQRGGSVEEVDRDLERCQAAFERVLGKRATALCGPWGYYRGLGDRPDLLAVAHRHGFRILRTWGRDEYDGQPVPLTWQPMFYRVQGFPHILELFIHGYQDDFYYDTFTQLARDQDYQGYLRCTADQVAGENLVWSLCSHDHHCATDEGWQKKAVWYRAVIERALENGSRFLTAGEYYQEMRAGL